MKSGWPPRRDDDEPWYNPRKTPLANLVLGFYAIVIVLFCLLAIVALIARILGFKW